MPQWALARLTPAIGGRSGKRVGASGEAASMFGPSKSSGGLPSLLLGIELVGRGAGRQRWRAGRRAAGSGSARRRQLRRRAGGRQLAAVERKDLDLGRLVERLDVLADDLLRHFLREARRLLLVRQRLGGPAVFDLDDV